MGGVDAELLLSLPCILASSRNQEMSTALWEIFRDNLGMLKPQFALVLSVGGTVEMLKILTTKP